jgi:hypothetical protein
MSAGYVYAETAGFLGQSVPIGAIIFSHPHAAGGKAWKRPYPEADGTSTEKGRTYQ